MRVAIITLHGYFNYGNRLQNYALQDVLTGIGCEVCTIAVEKDTNVIKQLIKHYFEIKNNKRRLKNRKELIRERNIKNFSNNNIYTKVFYHEKGLFSGVVNSMFDAFVVGSDQVWNPYFWEDDDNSCDLYNFLLGFTKKVKVSYAASFGVNAISEDWKCRFKPFLKSFHAISVREADGVDILSDLGYKAEVVLDPTLLVDVTKWRKLERNIAPKNKFILLFFLGEKPDIVNKEIYKIAKENKAVVLDMMDEKSPYYTKGPEVFVELIDKAYEVYTDSFHATVFSILFHTPFSVFERKQANYFKMGSRIETLLKIAGISDGISKTNIKINRNFKDVDKRLENEKKKSVYFISKALDLNKKDDI